MFFLFLYAQKHQYYNLISSVNYISISYTSLTWAARPVDVLSWHIFGCVCDRNSRTSRALWMVLSSLLNEINLTDNLNNPECLSSSLICSSASFSVWLPCVCGHVTLKSFTRVRKAACVEQMIHFSTRKSEKCISPLCVVQHSSDCAKLYSTDASLPELSERLHSGS